ncbi:MAG: hypothetical protein AAF004_08415 [Pseudomonadota bacterium]
MVYKSLNDLPLWLRERIAKLAGDQAESWIHDEVPALGKKSVIEVMNLEDGEQRIRAYLQAVDGHFRL